MSINGFVQHLPGTFLYDELSGNRVTVNSSGRIGVDIAPRGTVPLGYQQLSVTTGAVSALTVPVGSEFAIVRNSSGQTMRWRDDGVAPTTAIGFQLPANSQFNYDGDLSALRIIKASGAAGELNVSYYRYE